MPEPNTKESIWTYQGTNGDNTTIVGVDNSFKTENGSFTVFTGMAFDYNAKSSDTTNSAVIDLKGNVPYGESCFSGGFRFRNKFGEKTESTQLRIQPVNVNVPIGNGVSLYATPYFVGKENWNSGNFDPVVGGFAGASYKKGNLTISLEGQYDRSLDRACDIGNKNRNSYSINAGISVSL